MKKREISKKLKKSAKRQKWWNVWMVDGREFAKRSADEAGRLRKLHKN